ncbi:hypothetical protein [Frigoribacterium salinisoli]
MNRTAAVVRLQLVRRTTWFLVPLVIMLVAAVATVIIQLAIQRATGLTPSSPEYAEGARNNPALAWSVSGYLVATGVASVSSMFPLASSLGTTRRGFAAGTLATHLIVSAYLAAVSALLLGLELLTGHWFVGIYVFDTAVLGSGNVGVLLLVVLLGSLAAFTIGSAFGAVWLRFGPRGPLGVAVVAVLLLAGLLLLLAPSLGDIAGAFRTWWLIVAGVALVLVASGGTTLSLRRASVR